MFALAACTGLLLGTTAGAWPFVRAMRSLTPHERAWVRGTR